jgi:hypothetical protein
MISRLSCTSGLNVLRAGAPCWSCVLITIELTLTGARVSSGTRMVVSNVPIFPVTFSRTMMRAM